MTKGVGRSTLLIFTLHKPQDAISVIWHS